MAKQNNEVTFLDLKSKIDQTLLDARRIFLSEAIESSTAEELIRKFWYLELSEPGKPIYFFINSPGGSVDSGFAIWDQIKLLTSPVITIVTGLAASMGSVLSLSASPGKRFATPFARIMIHQPLIGGVIRGQATDLEIQAKEMLKTRTTLIKVYMEATKKGYDEIEKAIDRDTWLSAEEALAFGLLDGIINSFDNLK